MSRIGRKKRHRAKALPPLDSSIGIEGRERVAPGGRWGGSWLAGKRPVLRFVLVLGGLMVVFNAFFYLWMLPSEVLHTYLDFVAELSAGVARILGDDATASGAAISSPKYSLSIRHGCDAIQVAAFFVFAVLASPISVSLWQRTTAIAVGVFLLLTLNLVRIVSLYYTGAYFPAAFEVMHVEVWQPVFIFLALFFWIMWVLRVTRSARKPDVTV